MLGHLGAFLARQDARKIQIADEGNFLAVSWLSAGESPHRGCFRESELEHLRTNRQADAASRSRATLLAALGQRLDRFDLDVARIEERTDAFQVSASQCGRYSNQRFKYWELNGGEPDATSEDSGIFLDKVDQALAALCDEQPVASAVGVEDRTEVTPRVPEVNLARLTPMVRPAAQPADDRTEINPPATEAAPISRPVVIVANQTPKPRIPQPIVHNPWGEVAEPSESPLRRRLQGL